MRIFCLTDENPLTDILIDFCRDAGLHRPVSDPGRIAAMYAR